MSWRGTVLSTLLLLCRDIVMLSLGVPRFVCTWMRGSCWKQKVELGFGGREKNPPFWPWFCQSSLL